MKTPIEGSAFANCEQLTEIKLPKNLENIGSRAFAYTAIESIDIPETVLSIGSSAFINCKNLKKIVIPHNVANIYGYTFGSCTSLTAVDISGLNLTLNEKPFYGLSKIITHVHIPSQLRPSYFAGKYGLPEDESCFFQIGADGNCPAAYCPFRDTIVGDINDDGRLNNTDIILLGRAYMAGEGNKYLAVADMNNDGRITNADIILLGRLYMTGK